MDSTCTLCEQKAISSHLVEVKYKLLIEEDQVEPKDKVTNGINLNEKEIQLANQVLIYQIITIIFNIGYSLNPD